MIKGIRGPNGEKWDTKVFYPEEIYPVARGDKPDMEYYFTDSSLNLNVGMLELQYFLQFHY
ncbi:hypothetical protein PFDSM3638_06100 [Pyrococcus furiosus DSM 3638]|uniref:Uncharacterized protein n=2 Tax=Pyrococcus furiosus TaxID=2261 RepID=A0A5C0XRG1_PYRFU|nr:hypothetical protein PFC_05315 [Pyrococcus furiosus COM1]QEK78868.1 hypothetical protein PFDSM3638_06100 [Pyrococcus furiosus DSM 3638]